MLGIGASLQAIREGAGISRRKMEMQANIGQSVLGRIENGRAACSTRTLHAYLEVCGVDLAELLATVAKGGKDVEKPKAGRPKGKGFDHSLLPPMTWAWREDLGCWHAMEMMKGDMKYYFVYEDGTARRENGDGAKAAVNGGTDKDSAIKLVNDWRFYHGWQL